MRNCLHLNQYVYRNLVSTNRGFWNLEFWVVNQRSVTNLNLWESKRMHYIISMAAGDETGFILAQKC